MCQLTGWSMLKDLAADRHAQVDTRRRNLGALLRRVHLGGAVSRVELADWLGVNRSTVMALTADLAAAGLVREVPATTSGRAGRPSFVVRPESAAVHVLAFDIAVDRLVAARVDLGGTVSARLGRPGPGPGPTSTRWCPCSPTSDGRCTTTRRRRRSAWASARPTAG